MQVTRGTTLAALVLVAVAAPVTAFALTDASQDDTTAPTRIHPGKDKADRPDKPAKPGKPDKAEKRDKGDKGDKAGPGARPGPAAGRDHAESMKIWTRCVNGAARGPKPEDHTGPAKEACGEKPMPPGQAKKAAR